MAQPSLTRCSGKSSSLPLRLSSSKAEFDASTLNGLPSAAGRSFSQRFPRSLFRLPLSAVGQDLDRLGGTNSAMPQVSLCDHEPPSRRRTVFYDILGTRIPREQGALAGRRVALVRDSTALHQIPQKMLRLSLMNSVTRLRLTSLHLSNPNVPSSLRCWLNWKTWGLRTMGMWNRFS